MTFVYIIKYIDPKSGTVPCDMLAQWNKIYQWCIERMGPGAPGRVDLNLKDYSWMVGITEHSEGVPRGVYIRDEEDIVAFKLTFGL